jgi:hypothetical protein
MIGIIRTGKRTVVSSLKAAVPAAVQRRTRLGGGAANHGGTAQPLAARGTRGKRKPAIGLENFHNDLLKRMRGWVFSRGLERLALLLGGLRHREQPYNLQSAHAFLVMILPLTLLTSMLTFSLPRTNGLLGCVHLLLFPAYLMLRFDQ